jgi:ribosome recycling factor
MPVDDILLDTEDKMDKTVQLLETSLRTIRSGRASRALVEHIRVEYYGTQSALGQIANIGVPEAQLIVVRPFDPTALSAIEKAIQKSDIGINPQNDGKLIRIVIPPLSEERRRHLATQVKNMGEETKVSLRNIRREGNKQAENEEDGGTITEDESKKTKEDIQDLIKQYEEKVDHVVKAKTQEIMTI